MDACEGLFSALKYKDLLFSHLGVPIPVIDVVQPSAVLCWKPGTQVLSPPLPEVKVSICQSREITSLGS